MAKHREEDDDDLAKSRANENEKPIYVKILMPGKNGRPAQIKPLKLKSNVNNRLVRFERGKVRLTAEGQDRGIQILTDGAVRMSRVKPVDAKAEALLAEAKAKRDDVQKWDDHARATKIAAKRGEPKPEPPKPAAKPKPEAKAAG